ncbi:tail fiber protein [Paenibacillus sp. FSL M8-0334]|uniref:phage tail protein n=1 Tax=Paenibacillus sp. FSL M8-0334 TaxID=2921623 RepID=UPI0030FBD0C4
MAEPFIGEIRLFAFGKVPNGWLPCNGQLLQVHQYQALYALIGPSYGGNGMTNFALPNLQGRVAVHGGQGAVGVTGGVEAHALTVAEMPQHHHAVRASSSWANNRQADGRIWAANETQHLYGSANNTQMSTEAIANAGQGQAHSNMQPYTALNYCIAVQGIFPSRD